MKHLSKFLRLSTAERQLLVKVALLSGVIKLGTRLLPFRTLWHLLAWAAGTRVGPWRADHTPPERIVEAVEAASRHVPGVKTCLIQALTVQTLLVRRGYPALLHIGVAREGEQGQFRAHAWGESEGRIIIGGSKPKRYSSLAILEMRDPKESWNQKL